MLYAPFMPSSPMAFCVWGNCRMNLKKHSQMSESVLFLEICHIHSVGRQRRQFRIFSELLQLVPGLRDRILDGTPDEIVLDVLFHSGLISHRSREVPLVPDRMIQKASKVLSLTGLLLPMNRSAPFLRVISKWIAASITNEPVRFYVLWSWIGITLSMFLPYPI